MWAAAQEVHLSGIVLNGATMMPMVDAVVHHDGHKYTVDEAGRTAVGAQRGDTISITHVGYRTANIVVGDSLATESMFAVMMMADTLQLSEVVVMPRPQVHLDENKPLNQQNMVADYNFRQMRQIAYTSPSPFRTYDAEQNQKMSIDRATNEMVYRHMIAPDQMVGVSLGTIFYLCDLIAKAAKGELGQQEIRPMDGRELRMILRNYAAENENKY